MATRGSTIMKRRCINLVCILIGFLVLISTDIPDAEGLPFPAPDLQRCRSSEDCCTPVLDTREPIQFQFHSSLPKRIRPAANLVDATYAAKLRKAYELMRALPDTDGRSLKNQAKLHCAYCDNDFYFEGNEYPLEIHHSWLFLPWHRMFVYFHERILANLLGDDTFALPFWNWDDQSPGLGSGNLLPELYTNETDYGGHNTSSLYDPTRNACAQRPNIVDIVEPFTGCLKSKSNDQLRSVNAHVMYTHLVTGPVTPLLFFGLPYRFGDLGGLGGGTLEAKPHGPIHIWVNIVKMLTNRLSAADPIFFAHHANVDRLWTIWKGLPGGIRKDLTDPDFLDTQFTYYDEHGRLVYVSVAQSLDTDKLRYKYQEVPIPWVTGAVYPNDTTPSWPLCYNDTTPSWPLCYNDTTDIRTMINNTKPFQSPLPFTIDPVTFRVDRNPSPRSNSKEEVLQLKAKLNWTMSTSFTAYVNLPAATSANEASTEGCREYLGSFTATPHEGGSLHIPGRMKWRVALRQKLRDLGAEGLAQVVITLVGSQFNVQTLNITSAKILHISE